MLFEKASAKKGHEGTPREKGGIVYDAGRYEKDLASVIRAVFAFQEALDSKSFQGLELRGIGPALMSGRIADIPIHPKRRSTWYVAVGSGGAWKTTNSGTTWSPIFDTQSSYSIGCVALDAANPEIVWVGTGENVSGRHVGYGDGVYRSLDGGRSFEAMGRDH